MLTEKFAINRKSWRSDIQEPAIFTVISSQAVLHRERCPRVEGTARKSRDNVLSHPCEPLLPSHCPFLFIVRPVNRATFVEEIAELVRVRHPNHHGRGVGDRAKTRFTLTQFFLRYLRLVMSRDTPRAKAGLPRSSDSTLP